MSEKYKTKDPQGIYFCTLTVVEWIDIFTRHDYCLTFLESVKFCQQNKGLVVYAYVIMPSHVHLIVSANGSFTLAEVLRDLKKFTSRKIVEQIEEVPESRRKWLLDKFAFAGKYLNRITNYKFWQDGNQPKECVTNAFLQQKLDYIHQNPVEAMMVYEAQHYVFSSAIDYAGGKGLLDVVLVD